MDELDRRLTDAGERWRASQLPPEPIDASTFRLSPRPPAWSLAVGVTAVAVVVIALAARQLGAWPGPAAEPTAGHGSPEATASLAEHSCDVTVPDPPFIASPPYPAAPPIAGKAWYGSGALWTILSRDGEIGRPTGTSQSLKTFWWSTAWSPQEEPRPAITVIATRVGAEGSYSFDDATNASSADFGATAMLVGVELPSPGCWRLTARYRDAELSYVLWITDR